MFNLELKYIVAKIIKIHWMVSVAEKMTEKSISEFENRSLQIIQPEQQRKKNWINNE